MDVHAAPGTVPPAPAARRSIRRAAAPRRAVLRRLRRGLVVSLVTSTLLLAVQGCGVAAAAVAGNGPTPQTARKIVEAYLTAEKVALTDHNEALALSLDAYAANDLTVAAFHIAGHGPLTTYDYGQPTVYVPRLRTFPHWFAAVVPERPSGGGPVSRVVMVFDRPTPHATWQLAGSATLDADAPPLRVALSGGYATALPTSDQHLLVAPDVVGAMQATIVDDGPASQAARVVAAGPHTTGLYRSNAAAGRQASARGEAYQWLMQGTSDPVFALRTTDGGAVVFYTMSLSATTTIRPSSRTASPQTEATIPMPTGAVRHLLPLHQHPIHHELVVDRTLQYLTIDPPAGVHGAQIRVVAAGGGPTYAGAH